MEESMKKLDVDYLVRHRQGVARWKNTVRRKSRRYNPYRYEVQRKVGGQLLITAPVSISIYDFSDDKNKCAYTQTLKFLRRIGKNLNRTDCLIDFSNTSKVSAAALVLVYAAIETALKVRTAKTDLIWSKKHHHVNQTIKSTNLHKVITGEPIIYELAAAKTLPIISSVGSEHMEEIIDFIQKRIYKTMSADQEWVYADAISETINNVGLHAYPSSASHDRKWWLMCTTIGNQLYLAIYDNGIGIPKTVVDRPWFLSSFKSTHPAEHQKLIELFPDFEKSGVGLYIPTIIPDERLIYLSMQGDVSGTKKEKHGQGSKSIMALVSDTPDGKLWVFSNNGLYTFWQTDQSPGEKKLKTKFPGTLVQWNIKLS
jgi:anti-anti-sigma regulatory factor